jgi:hypothetical protein
MVTSDMFLLSTVNLIVQEDQLRRQVNQMAVELQQLKTVVEVTAKLQGEFEVRLPPFQRLGTSLRQYSSLRKLFGAGLLYLQGVTYTCIRTSVPRLHEYCVPC